MFAMRHSELLLPFHSTSLDDLNYCLCEMIEDARVWDGEYNNIH